MGRNPTRFGIMGCAEISRKIARAIDLAPNAYLYAIASRSLHKAQTFAAVNGVPETVKIYGSYEELLDDAGVDAVYLPLPTRLHRRWAVAAAEKKKHVLLEKPVGVCVEEFDEIIEACESNGVQFMDGSMWLHHPRTAKMKAFITDPQLFGDVRFIHSTSTTSSTKQFLEENIRVKPELDTLGALGDLAWYCIGAMLWAKHYELPTQARALPDFTKNSAGVLLSCTASFLWGNSSNTTSATIHCSFLSHTSMDLAISGSRGSVRAHDFIIPCREDSASFEFCSGARFAELHVGWNVEAEEVVVASEVAQEVMMVAEFAGLVGEIMESGCCPDGKWKEISRKTQVVVDAVRESIDGGCKIVYL